MPVTPFGGTAGGGSPAVAGSTAAGTTVNLQQMSDLVNSSHDAVRALANIYTALQGFNIQVAGTRLALPVSTVAALPAVTLANVGNLAFASNGRNSGEGAGVGTGCLVQVQSKSGTATWCSTWSGVAVVA